MKNIWIDTDPGLDDTLAIMWAVRQEAKINWKILGISTVKGNISFKQTNINALAILEHLDRADIPVYAGASKALIQQSHDAEFVHGNKLGPFDPKPTTSLQRLKAPEALAQTLQNLDGKITLVTLGPLTNIAIFLTLYPELTHKIENIVIMGGGSYGNVTHYAEFNMYIDPEAAWMVFNSEIPITMSGLDVSDQYAYVTQKELSSYSDLIQDPWTKPIFEFLVSRGFEKTNLYDPTAMVAAACPELFETYNSPVTVQLTGDARGMTLLPTKGTFDQALPKNITTKVIKSCQRDLFHQRLFEGL